jgi:hypothetical protein
MRWTALVSMAGVTIFIGSMVAGPAVAGAPLIGKAKEKGSR